MKHLTGRRGSYLHETVAIKVNRLLAAQSSRQNLRTCQAQRITP